MKHIIIPICGFARAGKDSLANAIYDHLDISEPTYSVCVLKFADALKIDIEKALLSIGLQADVWTEDTTKKSILRPLLVAYGEYRRASDENVWVDKVIEAMSEWTGRVVPDSGSDYSLVLIPDLRYANEYSRLKELCDVKGHEFVPIYIERAGNGPANDAEAGSIGLMAARGYFSTPNALQLSFGNNDVDQISLWAKKFTESLSIYR